MATRRRAVRYAAQLDEAIREYRAAARCTDEDACEAVRAAAGYAPKSPAIKNMRNARYEVGRYRPIRWRHNLIVAFFAEAGLSEAAAALDDSYAGESLVLAAQRARLRHVDGSARDIWFTIPDDDA